MSWSRACARAISVNEDVYVCVFVMVLGFRVCGELGWHSTSVQNNKVQEMKAFLSDRFSTLFFVIIARICCISIISSILYSR